MRYLLRTCMGGFAALLLYSAVSMLLVTGCAQIGAPTGGPKDTLPPVLVKALPAARSVDFSGNRISFTFNEYVDLQDLQNNLLVSPLQKSTPTVTANLKTVTLKFKDTLLPITTYSISFGDAIKDINEGNVLKNFSYVFSTGDHIDSFSLKGRIIMAQTGKPDSTLSAILYRNAPDTAVTSRKPDYMTRLNGDGSFLFSYLPAGNYRVYALKDGDGNKYYNSQAEIFAFSEEQPDPRTQPVVSTLYAYATRTSTTQQPANFQKKEADKKLRYSPSIVSGQQDLLEPLVLTFKNKLKKTDADSIVLMDTNYKKIEGYHISSDSTLKKLSVSYQWTPGMVMRLVIYKNALEDTAGLTLSGNDTIRFSVRNTNEYGSLQIRFKNIDLSRHPLLQFMDGETVKSAFPVTDPLWKLKMMLPGEYEVRLLYDTNNNGKWDPGDYTTRLQPEAAIGLPQKISIKADWDNEREVNLVNP